MTSDAEYQKGAATADALIASALAAGESADQIEAAAERLASGLFSDAAIPAGRAFAAGFDDAARDLLPAVRELELEAEAG